MIQVILLIMGIVYFFRKNKISKVTSESFPHIPKDQFEEWKRLEVKSIDIFLWGTWGLFIISFPLAFILVPILLAIQSQVGQDSPIVFAYPGLMLVALLTLLFISALIGSKAAKLQKSLGIDLRNIK